MATNLTAIFGNEISVAAMPRQAERQYVGIPGVHGVLAMHMGSRGRAIIVTGKLRGAADASYETARANCQTKIDTIESYQWLGSDDYTFKGKTYYDVVFEYAQLLTDAEGKVFHWNSIGQVTVDFIWFLRELI